MAYRGARVGGAIADSASQFGQLLMQLIMRKDRQGQFDAASDAEQTRYDAGIKWRDERADIEDKARTSAAGLAAEANRRDAIKEGWKPLAGLGRPLAGSVLGGLPGAAIQAPGIDPRALTADTSNVNGERMAYMPPEKKPLVNLSRGGQTITGADIADAPRLWAGMPKDVEAPMTANQREQLAIQRAQLALEGRRVGVAERTAVGGAGGGIPGISKLPVEAQKGITTALPTYSALQDYEQMSRDYLARSRGDRTMGKLGKPGAQRDAALGGLKAQQQVLIGSMKNMLELGVLAGPDIGIVMGMIGDPTTWESVGRDPEYTMSKFPVAKKFLDDKVKAFEATYGVVIPRPETPVVTPPGRGAGAGGPGQPVNKWRR